MLKNYFFTLLRNYRKNKLYTFINTCGLAIGLAVAFLIGIYVQNETSYDRWIPNHEKIYRVYRHWLSGSKVVWTPDPIAEAMVDQIPEIVKSAGLSPNGETLIEYNGDKWYVDKVAQTDSTFFEVIDLPLKYGSANAALKAPNSLVLSDRLAGIFFEPGENPVGKILRFNDEYDLMVTGILAQPPGNTHLHYEVYVRYDWSSPSWTGNNRATYVRLSGEPDLGSVEQKITNLIRPYWEKEIRDDGGDPAAQEFPNWRLQPLKEIHLESSKFSWIDGSGGNVRYIAIFLLIAGIVLIIAGINYVNLSTARAVERAKEVGVRKVSGARRSQLMIQFIGEAFFQTLIAFVLAIGIAGLFLPYFNGIINRELYLIPPDWPVLLIIMIVIILLMSVLAGGYPAIVMSSFKPVSVLKGRSQIAGRSQFFRQILVVLQFAMSVVLVVVMLFIYRQVNYMMNEELGFSSDQVLSIPLNSSQTHRKIEQLKSEIRSIPGVEEVTTASRLPGYPMPDWTIQIEGQFETHSPYTLFVDEDYVNTLGLKLVEGRFFSHDFPADTANAFVVNQAFVKEFNIRNPIGQKVKFSSAGQYSTIVGVLQDYHYRGLDTPIRPVIFGARHNRWYSAIRLSSANISQSIRAIEELWQRIEPAHPFRYTFLDENFARQYDEYKRFGNALLYATVFTLLVAILGLFGLVTYVTTTKTKEIGIRKVLGAQIYEISYMLTRDFVKWVFIAGIIAVPVSWYLVKSWLEDFAFQTDISPVPFALAILGALLLAGLTVMYRTNLAARKDPVHALRYE